MTPTSRGAPRPYCTGDGTGVGTAFFGGAGVGVGAGLAASSPDACEIAPIASTIARANRRADSRSGA